MFTKITKIVALAIVCAMALSMLVSCDLFEKECDHDYGKWKVEKEASCTEEGLKTRKCSECREKKEKVIPKLDHEFDYYGYCEVCGMHVNDVPTEYPSTSPTEDPSIGDGPSNNGGVMQFTDIYEGSVVYVSANTTDGYKYFRFVPNESGTYVFESYENYYNGSYIDTYAALCDDTLSSITSNDDGGENNNFKISQYLYAGETYYLRVSNYGNVETGYFYIMVCCEVPTQQIYVGDCAGVNIANSGEVKRFKFVPSVSGPYTFYGSSSDYIDSYATLYDRNGNTITNVDGGASNGHFKVVEYLIAGEEYYLDVRMYSSYETGYFYLNLLGFSTMNESYGTYVQDTSDAGVGSFLSFIPSESGTYVFYASNYSGSGAYVYATLYDDDLCAITSSGYNSDYLFYISCELEAGEEYLLHLEDNNYNSYYYAYVERDESVDFNCDTIYEGNSTYVYTSNNYTYYKFVPETSGTYEFKSFDNYYYGSYVDTYGAILDENLNTITSNDDAGDNYNFYMTYYLEAGETYYLCVSDSGASSSYAGYYITINLQSLTYDTTIYAGSNVYVSIEESYEYKMIRFVPEYSGYYEFYSSYVDSHVDAKATLCDVYGSELTSNDDGNGDNQFYIFYYLEAGQTYYLKAYVHSSGTGSYYVYCNVD